MPEKRDLTKPQPDDEFAALCFVTFMILLITGFITAIGAAYMLWRVL